MVNTNKYTSVCVHTANTATIGNSGTELSTLGTDKTFWEFQINENAIDADKKTNTGRMVFTKSESSASDATTALAKIKTGYATTIIGIYTSIANVEAMVIESRDLSIAASGMALHPFAAIAAAIITAIAF